eukprot:524931_1
MRRLSAIYQDQQSQVKAMEHARKKAAILQYNKFKLPNMNQETKRKWNIQAWDKQLFNIPDSKSMPNGKPNYNIKPKTNYNPVPATHTQNNYYDNSQAQWTNQQQPINNSYKQQQRQQYGMQNKQYYNSPYKQQQQASIFKYNKFKLPDINKSNYNKRKWNLSSRD